MSVGLTAAGMAVLVFAGVASWIWSWGSLAGRGKSAVIFLYVVGVGLGIWGLALGNSESTSRSNTVDESHASLARQNDQLRVDNAELKSSLTEVTERLLAAENQRTELLASNKRLEADNVELKAELRRIRELLEALATRPGVAEMAARDPKTKALLIEIKAVLRTADRFDESEPMPTPMPAPLER